MKIKLAFILLFYFHLFSLPEILGDTDIPTLSKKEECAEAEACVKAGQKNKIASQKAGVTLNGDTTMDKPSYQPEGGIITLGIGLLAILSGSISATAILITGGIFAVLGILLLIFYKKLKRFNPFKLRGGNILAKIFVALFFFLLLMAMIGAIILAFVVAVALLIAAILSSVVSPVVVALVIIGIGVAWWLVNLIRYLIKMDKYKKSLNE